MYLYQMFRCNLTSCSSLFIVYAFALDKSSDYSQVPVHSKGVGKYTPYCCKEISLFPTSHRYIYRKFFVVTQPDILSHPAN